MYKIRTIAFVKLWSITMYNISYLFDSSRSVIKSIITIENKYAWGSALIGIKESANGYVLTFIYWYSIHSYI